jgi:phosphoribosylamine-glycine ligase
MATANGVRLIEYNARFGDPEAMNIVSVLSSDLLELCWAAAMGDLHNITTHFEPKATVCTYVVPVGYPKDKNAGDAIEVREKPADENTRLYWAAVEQVDSQILLTGSRALAVVGIGDTLQEAEARAVAGAASVRGAVRFRSDIGTTAAIARRVEHMRGLRQKAI